jgi:Lrp/AsnC family transcriptional regulator, regulator for asnA, asnC and gidA
MARLVNDTDRAIIRLLQNNARMSYAELSRATGTPESTVRRRMDRLQQRGVIEFAMVAEPAKLGYDLRAMIGLKVDLHRLTEIADQLRAMNEITFAAFLTGNFDIMIHVVVESQEDLVGLLTEKLSKIDGVRSTETFVMPWIIKPTTSWVLPEHEAHPPAETLDDGGDDEDTDDLVEDGAEMSFAERVRQRRGIGITTVKGNGR